MIPVGAIAANLLRGSTAGGGEDVLPAAFPTYVASGAIDGGSGNGTIGSLALPTGWQAGDYHILSIASRLGSAHTVNTSGWTHLATATPTDTAFTDDREIKLYGRVAEGGDTAVSVTQSSGGGLWSAQVHGFRGVNPATPIDDIDTASDEGSALSFPSLDTTGPKRLIVGFIGINGCASYANTNLSNITERKDNIAASGYGQCMFTGEKAALGSTGATTAAAPNTDGYGLPILALRPTNEPDVSYESQEVLSIGANSIMPALTVDASSPFTLVGGSLPPGMSLNSSTGEISGQASATGTYPDIKIRCAVPSGTSDSPPFTLTAVDAVDEYEMRFFGSNDGAGDVLIRELTMATSHGGSDITSGRPTSGSPGVYSGAEGPDKAINDNTGDWWQPRCTPAASGQVTFGITFASAVNVTEITLDPHPSFLTRTPKAMDLYGKDGSGNWHLLQSFTGWTSWSGLRTINW